MRDSATSPVMRNIDPKGKAVLEDPKRRESKGDQWCTCHLCSPPTWQEPGEYPAIVLLGLEKVEGQDPVWWRLGK